MQKYHTPHLFPYSFLKTVCIYCPCLDSWISGKIPSAWYHVYNINLFTISQNISASTGAKGEVKSSFYYSLILFTNILVIKANLLSFLIPITWMFFSIFFIKERGSRTSRLSKIKLYILIIYFSSVLPANNWVINLYYKLNEFFSFFSFQRGKTGDMGKPGQVSNVC